MLYAKLDDQGRVVQESVAPERPVIAGLEGYVPVLAVRREGVAELRGELGSCRWQHAQSEADYSIRIAALEFALRVLGLEEGER